MRKQLFAILLAGLIMSGMTACGDSNNTDGKKNQNSTAYSATGNKDEENADNTGNDKADEPTAEDKTDSQAIEEYIIGFDFVSVRTTGGDCYRVDEDSPKEPVVYLTGVKKFVTGDKKFAADGYIDMDNNYISNGVDLEHGGSFNNEKLLENVEDVVTIMNFTLYLTVDGKAFMTNTEMAYGDNLAVYGGTDEICRDKPVADNVKSIGSIDYNAVYINNDNELYILRDNEWSKLYDNVDKIVNNVIFTNDGTLVRYGGYDEDAGNHLYVIAEGAEDIYENTTVYKKDGLFYNYRYRYGEVNNYVIDDKAGENHIDNIEMPLYSYESVLIYEGTDDMLHYVKYGSFDGNMRICYDETGPIGFDGMDETYDFMQRKNDIEMSWE